MGIALKSIAACALLAGAGGALAQIKCTMPNGKTITLQTAKRCAADATKWETLEGQDITPASAPKPAPAAPPVASAPKKGETYIVPSKPQPVRRDPVDTAIAICAAIKKSSTAWCNVEQFSAPLNRLPSIKIWDDVDMAGAIKTCRTFAEIALEMSGGTLRERHWSIKVYSKHSYAAPLTTCQI